MLNNINYEKYFKVMKVLYLQQGAKFIIFAKKSWRGQ